MDFHINCYKKSLSYSHPNDDDISLNVNNQAPNSKLNTQSLLEMCQNNSNLAQILEEKFVLVDSNMEVRFHVPGIEDKHC